MKTKIETLPEVFYGLACQIGISRQQYCIENYVVTFSCCFGLAKYLFVFCHYHQYQDLLLLVYLSSQIIWHKDESYMYASFYSLLSNRVENYLG